MELETKLVQTFNFHPIHSKSADLRMAAITVHLSEGVRIYSAV